MWLLRIGVADVERIIASADQVGLDRDGSPWFAGEVAGRTICVIVAWGNPISVTNVYARR
jgi:hypothetical protein